MMNGFVWCVAAVALVAAARARGGEAESLSVLPPKSGGTLLHAYLLAGLIYFLMAFPLSMMTRRVELRLRRGMRRITA